MKKILIAIFFVLTCLSVLVWEKNRLVMMDEKITYLKTEYDRVKSENDSIMYRINSILALEKLDQIAKEKNFIPPTQNTIVNIYE
jgi:uncharacterized protein YxeA